MLSDRLRPGVEAAPWVIEEVRKLEQEPPVRVEGQSAAQVRQEMAETNRGEPTMKIDITKKYKTRDGRPVRILCTDLDDDARPRRS